MLIHLQENITNSLNITYLNLFGTLAILSGICVILSRNPIVSVLFLIFLFLDISLYLMFLGLNFIGLSYLLVYVGAVSILFLFVLMLINVRISEIVSSTLNSVPLAITIGTLFYLSVTKVLPNNNIQSNLFKKDLSLLYNKETYYDNLHETLLTNNLNQSLNIENSINSYFNQTKFSSLNTLNYYYNVNSDVNLTSVYTWDTLIYNNYYINTIGNILYITIPMWLILTSLILLLAMVGCILITVSSPKN